MSDADTCTLCDLSTPTPPVTDDAVGGTYCCRGCLEVARRLDAPVSGATVEDAAGLDTGPDADPDGEGETAYLAVEGMHCSACEAFVEATATDDDGVLAAEASYPADAVKVTYDPRRVDRNSLPGLVDGLGYGAALAGGESGETPGKVGGDPRAGTAARLVAGGFFGMMIMLWYVLFLYPAYLGVDPDTLLIDLEGIAGTYLLANVWVMATVVLFFTGFPVLRGAYVSLRAGQPNMDLLVALAASTAYVYSTVTVLLGGTDVYFDVSVVVVLAVTLGNYYEERVKKRAAGMLADLTTERVDEARRRTTDGGTTTVAVSDLDPGEEVLVKAGERVPVDGTVIEGRAAVDNSLVTGESAPVPVDPGETVVGGAVATDGALIVEVGADATSTLDRLTEFLWESRATRSGASRLADRLAGAFVPLAVGVSVLAGTAHLLTGASPTEALLTTLAVLVVSCPCALGLATPLATAAGVGAALRRGIVVTDGAAFESITGADVVAFDKTGTLTRGEFEVRAVHAAAPRPDGGHAAVDGSGTPDREERTDRDKNEDEDKDGDESDRERELLARAGAVERRAEHPLAAAVVDAAEGPLPEVTNFERHPGRGVEGVVDGDRVVVGRPDLLADEGFSTSERLRKRYDAADAAGETSALVGWAGRTRGVVVAADRPREEWETVVTDLAVDREVVVITGDRGGAADRFREHPAVDAVYAGVPPEAKAAIVERLRAGEDRDGDGDNVPDRNEAREVQRRTVAMVGDGTNDAPALAAADAGIAVERGAKLAADAADAVVTTDDLRAVPAVFDLTAATRKRVRGNLAWAFLYNGIAVPLAALGLINPLFAAVAMATSSLLVVTNSARSLGPADPPPKSDAGRGPEPEADE
jgi:Cu2+-exporting ATPase